MAALVSFVFELCQVDVPWVQVDAPSRLLCELRLWEKDFEYVVKASSLNVCIGILAACLKNMKGCYLSTYSLNYTGPLKVTFQTHKFVIVTPYFGLSSPKNYLCFIPYPYTPTDALIPSQLQFNLIKFHRSSRVVFYLYVHFPMRLNEIICNMILISCG